LFRRLTSSSAWSRRARTCFFCFIEKFIMFEIIHLQMQVNSDWFALTWNFFYIGKFLKMIYW
jgi:hypothetical protein